MRSSALIMIVLGTALAACATPEQKAACFAVSGWETPTFRCASAPAPVAVVETPPSEPARPEPEPEPTTPPKAEVKTENIELSETVQFETNSAVLLDRSRSLLDQVVQALNDHPEVKKVLIEGHTDSVASTRHNKKLSEQRVASVKTYLVDKGIDAGRLKTKGFGETKPVASNKTEEGRAKNRRVDFKILERN